MALLDQHIRNDIHLGFKQYRATGIPRFQKPVAALTGTLLTTPTEGEVVTGGQTIICTLKEGTFLPAALFDASRQALIDGLNSAGAEAHGWNVEVRDKAAVTTMVRTSATQVTFTAPASASYAIAANETITWTIPANAINGGPDPVAATPSFAVVAS